MGKAERAIARAEAGATAGTRVVGPLQAKRAQHADEGLGPPARQTGRAGAYGAGGVGSYGVRVVGVESPLKRLGSDRKGQASRGRLDGLEIEKSDDFATYEGLDLAGGLRLDCCDEPPFSASACL